MRCNQKVWPAYDISCDKLSEHTTFFRHRRASDPLFGVPIGPEPQGLAKYKRRAMSKRFYLLTASACAISAAFALGGCSTASLPSVGSINPFGGGNTISEVDRAYLQAAGSWDMNHDSVVTCDEWKAYAEDLFNGADANHDDFLDATEWQNLTNVDKMFVTADLKYFDANGDGKVSRQEFVDKPNPAFVLMDKGGTCKLDANQIASARSKTEYDLSGTKPQNSDPREQGGQQGQAANGALPGQ